MTLIRPVALSTAVLAACTLSACGTPPARPPSFSQAGLPVSVQVPDGHRVALETVGTGEITYECREKASSAGQFEWVFVGPQAELRSRTGQAIGRYFGPPATWLSQDGSQLTGTQLAVAPGQPGSLPLQLVKANPAVGAGALAGVSHIQRVATQGGVAPSSACNASGRGSRQVVKYQADYIFYKPV